MRTTEEVLKDLLTEDTGKHFLDSGGDNGRHWQRNKDRDFDKEPIVVPEFYNGELEYVTVNVYHYLKEVLELDDLCYCINNGIQTCHTIGWVGDITDEWMDETLRLYDWEWKGNEWNTYNGESNLSQVLQGRFFVVDDEPYVMLQIHQGADVRGGYTQPKCFKLKGLLMGNVDICGSVNDLPIDNMYNGYSLTDEKGNEVDIKETDDLVLDMLICEETCVY